MKKKEYLAPEMKVIKLHQQQHLLASSSTGTDVFNDEDNWADEDEETL